MLRMIVLPCYVAGKRFLRMECFEAFLERLQEIEMMVSLMQRHWRLSIAPPWGYRVLLSMNRVCCKG